jgi:hypothetical protein
MEGQTLPQCLKIGFVSIEFCGAAKSVDAYEHPAIQEVDEGEFNRSLQHHLV